MVGHHLAYGVCVFGCLSVDHVERSRVCVCVRVFNQLEPLNGFFSEIRHVCNATLLHEPFNGIRNYKVARSGSRFYLHRHTRIDINTNQSAYVSLNEGLYFLLGIGKMYQSDFLLNSAIQYYI